MKRKYIVYTDNGDYTDIFAWTPYDAMRQVYRMTCGRANPYRAEEVAR